MSWLKNANHSDQADESNGSYDEHTFSPFEQ
jgi:hypothetical protein